MGKRRKVTQRTRTETPGQRNERRTAAERDPCRCSAAAQVRQAGQVYGPSAQQCSSTGRMPVQTTHEQAVPVGEADVAGARARSAYALYLLTRTSASSQRTGLWALCLKTACRPAALLLARVQVGPAGVVRQLNVGGNEHAYDMREGAGAACKARLWWHVHCRSGGWRVSQNSYQAVLDGPGSVHCTFRWRRRGRRRRWRMKQGRADTLAENGGSELPGSVTARTVHHVVKQVCLSWLDTS